MWKKLIAGVLAASLTCAATGCTPSDNPQQTYDISNRYMVLVDEDEADLYDGYEKETPSLYYSSALTGGAEIIPTSTLDSDSSFSSGTGRSTSTSVKTANSVAVDEVRAVWISYLEMEHLLKNKTSKQFRTNISAVFDNIQEFGLNTAIVQVRPFGDALYASDYFPWSYSITGTEGKDPGFDPLQIMVEEAKSRGLRIEAWINPYRIRAAGNINALASSNPAKKWLDSGNLAVIEYDGATTYNPASKNARELIVNGVREIVRKYNVDGIHIDDYFYPATNGTLPAAYDKTSYNVYKQSGGTMSLDAWRRNNVETLIKAMYDAIKEEKSNVLFGISPQSSVYNNYYAQHLDVKKIVSNPGYCDYICPQIYFGYKNSTQPYAETLKTWSNMVTESSVDLYVGLAAYKIGTSDSWAGATGKTEWQQSTNMLARMLEDARSLSNYGGFAIYRYDSLFNPAAAVKSSVEKEARNLEALM